MTDFDTAGAVLAEAMRRLTAGAPHAEIMDAVVTDLAGRYPHPAWQVAQDIEWVADLDASRSWFSGMVTGAPHRGVAGLWFGINEPVRAGGVACDFYLGGRAPTRSTRNGRRT